MFNQEEVAKVRAALEDPNGVQKYTMTRPDGTKNNIRMTLWNHPGHDVTGVMARTERLINTAEQVSGRETGTWVKE